MARKANTGVFGSSPILMAAVVTQLYPWIQADTERSNMCMYQCQFPGFDIVSQLCKL